MSSLSSSERVMEGVESKDDDEVDLKRFLDSLDVVPKVIVFDLDNTLWTPELYQIRQRHVPVVNQDIRLFDAAEKILEFFANNKKTRNVQLALASRTSKTNWAHSLLDDFTVKSCGNSSSERVSIRSLFRYIEIQPGSKKAHFATIKRKAATSYSEMLFIDDDLHMNLNEISSQLGVLCCHTPRGLTMEHFCKSLQKYSELKTTKSSSDNNDWMGYILTNENLNIAEKRSVPSTTTAGSGKVLQGRIKFYSPQKRFGFVVDKASNQEFFVHESKVPAGMILKSGDNVTFEALGGGGRPSAVIVSPSISRSSNSRSATSTTTTTTTGENSRRRRRPVENENENEKEEAVETMEMPCFSMSQPFAALLLNGVKTVESRNNPIFQTWKPGTRILVSCGRRDWPDQESYQKIIAQESGISKTAAELPRPFRKGQVVGIITIGTTRLTTAAERNDPHLQRQVLAYADGIGKYCTEIREAKWLAKPFSLAKGQPGIFMVQAPKDCFLQSPP